MPGMAGMAGIPGDLLFFLFPVGCEDVPFLGGGGNTYIAFSRE